MVTIFPANVLGVKVELLLNTTWTDISTFVYQRDDINITGMGRADEQGTIQSSQVTLTLNNTDGRFTAKNASGAYYPNILRNTQIRISINSESATLVVYNGFRFFGEISAWPVVWDPTGKDVIVNITASGIWRRISQSSTNIGSSFTRYMLQQTGTNIPATYWAMEDGGNSNSFVTTIGAGGNATFSGTPSFAQDSTSFLGSDSLPQFNGARITANVSSAATPTNNVMRFVLSVPAAGDAITTTFALGGELANMIMPSGVGIKRISVSLNNNSQIQIQGWAATIGGSALFTSVIATKVNGTPVLVSAELTPSGSSVAWALRIIKPGAAAVLDQVTGTQATSTIAAVTQVRLNQQGRIGDSTFGQLAVFYTVPSLVTAAAALGGHAGEFAVDRFNRICAEFGIASTVIGSTSAAMGPQSDDQLSNIFQSIENTDGGLLYETRDQFGLGYRTLGSMQNQSVAVTLNYAAGVFAQTLAPTYDDQLVKNQWTVTNWDGYTAVATLTSGAISVQAVPNGIGIYSGGPINIIANTHAQVNAIAQQKLFQGTVDDFRYPSIPIDMKRAEVVALFASVPGLRIGDYMQITNPPTFVSGSTIKQLVWGYTESINALKWTITFNGVPELPFETTFSPGVFSVVQGPTGPVSQTSSIGGSVSGSQIDAGSVGGNALAPTISARSVGGVTSFIAAATPYDWTFAVSGTPADATYFICTEDQALPINIGDTFTNSGGLGGPFTVTSMDPPSGGNVNVHFTPDASAVMSTGTVFGGKNGDTWVNSSGGNQVNQWVNGAWVPISFNASNVLQTGTVTATQIAAATITAGLMAAGIVVSGIVNATTIVGAVVETASSAPQVILDGNHNALFAYDGATDLLFALASASGTDFFGHAYPAGAFLQQLTLNNQAGSPTSFSTGSVFYSSVAGRPRYLSSAGSDNVLERSQVNVSQFSSNSTVSPGATIGAPLAYLANEGNQSSEFEIEIDGKITTGSGTANVLSFGLGVDGAILGGQFGIGAVFLVSSATFAYTLRFRLSILTSGAGGTAFVACDGVVQNQVGNIGNSNISFSVAANSSGITKSFDSTSNHTIQPYCFFASSSTGQIATTYRTKVARRM